MNSSKLNNQTHLYFISLIAIHYLIPIICVGQIIVSPLDNLEIGVVYDHIISKIYKGDIEKISYFLSGEIKWYFRKITCLFLFLSSCKIIKYHKI